MALQQDIDGIISSASNFVNQTRNGLDSKANISDVYNKTETDAIVNNLSTKAETNVKADKSDTYTKSEVNDVVSTSFRISSESDFRRAAIQNLSIYTGAGFADTAESKNSRMTTLNSSKNYEFSKYLYLGNKLNTEKYGSVSDARPVIVVDGVQIWIDGTNLRDTYNLNSKDKHIHPNFTASVKVPALSHSTSKLFSLNSVNVEVWREKVSDRDFVYPFGNVQFSPIFDEDLNSHDLTIYPQEVKTWFGLQSNNPKLVHGDFADKDTYSLFGSWDTLGSTIGYGYKWSTLTTEEKSNFISKSCNNIYIDSTGIHWQIRYKFTVLEFGKHQIPSVFNFSPALVITIKSENAYRVDSTHVAYKNKSDFSNGLRETKASNNGGSILAFQKSSDGSLYYKGYVFSDIDADSYILTDVAASVDTTKDLYLVYDTSQSTSISLFSDSSYGVPVAMLARRNRGIFHPVHNPYGSASVYKAPTTDPLYWYEVPNDYIQSIEDCFNFDKVAVWDPVNTGVNSVNARKVSGTTLDNVELQPNFDGSKYYVTGTVDSTWSGREDQAFVDSVESGDILDLRINVNPVI